MSGGRYKPPPGAESETQPGSRGRVLRNRLGITRVRNIERAEFEALVVAQEIYVRDHITADTRFTAALLCRMHADWLGGIYEWAGSYRTVNVAKGDFAWPPAYLVASNMEVFERGLLREMTPCPPSSIKETAHRLAVVHAEFLLIHPFRDGNGRMARWLADLMALQAGLARPAYRFGGPGSVARRTRYLNGVKRGYRMDFAALTAFFVEVLEDGAREASRAGG